MWFFLLDIYQSYGSFEFIKVSIIGTFWLLLKNWCSYNTVYQENCGRPVFLQELQAARNFSKVSLYFNKMPNSLRQVLQTYSETCILCLLQQNSPPEGVCQD